MQEERRRRGRGRKWGGRELESRRQPLRPQPGRGGTVYTCTCNLTLAVCSSTAVACTTHGNNQMNISKSFDFDCMELSYKVVNDVMSIMLHRVKSHQQFTHRNTHACDTMCNSFWQIHNFSCSLSHTRTHCIKSTYLVQ